MDHVAAAVFGIKGVASATERIQRRITADIAFSPEQRPKSGALLVCGRVPNLPGGRDST
jgi:hypothetical protein